jgi:phage shock protein A
VHGLRFSLAAGQGSGPVAPPTILFAEAGARHYRSAMFKDLQKLFRETWGSFREELGRREPEDEVAELLGRMRREMVDARAEVPLLDEAVRGVERELERERRALADCERRAGMAERIGDAETVRVAGEFADRHREHIRVLEQKRLAAIGERDLRAREVQQMSERYKAADANRMALLSEIRRQRARQALDPQGGVFADFARMEDAVADDAAQAAAYEDLSSELAGEPPPSDPADRIRALEDRLEELKRRMGKS